MQLEADGTVSVFVGSSAVGQGVETVFAQIAADALEMPMERIKGVFHGSTDLLHEGFGSYSSRSVVMGGSAILAAAAKLRDAIRAAAAQAARLRGGRGRHRRRHGGRAGPVIGGAEGARAGISVDGTYASNKRTYSYGAHAAHVAVDPKTGQVEVHRLRGGRGRRPHHQSARRCTASASARSCRGSAARCSNNSSTTRTASC